MKFNVKYFLIFIIGILCLLLLLQRGCKKPDNLKPTIVERIKIDTIWKESKTDTVYISSKPITITKPSEKEVKEVLIPDTTYNGLRIQFDNLKNDYLTKKVYNNKIPIDSIGNIDVTQYISKNSLDSFRVKSNYKIPNITKTVEREITLPYQPKRQVYIGGELTGSTATPLNGANIVLTYKDRADRMYHLKAGGLNTNGIVRENFGAGMSWKINLRR